jgi:hypothetical protein
MSDLIGRTLKGMTKSVLVEEDAITISYRALYHGFKGDKRIPYNSITAVQWREAGSWLCGYMQLSIKGAMEWHGPINQDENAIDFDRKSDDFHPLRDFIQSKIAGSNPAQAQSSLADELAKLAQLRDQGILTDDEFASQKAKLLG